jgi:prepilin-type N-terminal cleavage/methylation domain-containing protein
VKLQPIWADVRRAFSLVEILVVVALLSVIVLGLLAMFTQTQRAFRTGLTQVEVLESGRLVTELVVRELEQIAPAYQPGPGFNFFAEIIQNRTALRPFLQTLPGNTTGPKRTNFLQDVFFVTRHNQEWVGIGYFVRVSDQKTGALSIPQLGVGTLYRFQTNATALSGRTILQMAQEFDRAKASEFRATKVADGVAHFLTRAYATNGFRIVEPWGAQQNIYAVFDKFLGNEIQIAGEIERYEFYSNAVPAAVELEMGILEDRAWQHYRALPTINSQSNYLAGLAGRLHVFRQRVPIRNVDPVAYQ